MHRPLIDVLCLISVVVLSACATPEPLRKGAELSSTELALLQTELQNYAKNANANIKERTARLQEQVKVQLALKREEEEALYIGLANEKQMENFYKELLNLANRLQEREAAALALQAAYAERLSSLTQALKIPTESFQKTQEALARLAEKASIEQQLAFIQQYVKDVKTEFEAKRKAEASGGDGR
jgi:hypothetical protein